MDKNTLIAGYSVSQRLISGNTDGIGHEESLVQPSPAGNSMNWVAGHLLVSRGQILGLLGAGPFLSEDEKKLYQRGSAPVKPAGESVDFGRLRDGLEQTAGTITGVLAGADESFLEEELDLAGFPIKMEKPSRGAYLALFLFHEGYHAGQLGIVRRLLGKESVAK